jgi:hypothetical protein
VVVAWGDHSHLSNPRYRQWRDRATHRRDGPAYEWLAETAPLKIHKRRSLGRRFRVCRSTSNFRLGSGATFAGRDHDPTGTGFMDMHSYPMPGHTHTRC